MSSWDMGETLKKKPELGHFRYCRSSTELKLQTEKHAIFKFLRITGIRQYLADFQYTCEMAEFRQACGADKNVSLGYSPPLGCLSNSAVFISQENLSIYPFFLLLFSSNSLGSQLPSPLFVILDWDTKSYTYRPSSPFHQETSRWPKSTRSPYSVLVMPCSRYQTPFPSRWYPLYLFMHFPPGLRKFWPAHHPRPRQSRLPGNSRLPQRIESHLPT